MGWMRTRALGTWVKQRLRAVHRGTEELQLKSLPLGQLQENFADSFLSLYSFKHGHIQKSKKYIKNKKVNTRLSTRNIRTIRTQNRNSVRTPGRGLGGPRVRMPEGTQDFSLPPKYRLTPVPTQLPIHWVRESFPGGGGVGRSGRDVKLTTRLHLMSRLMSGAIPLPICRHDVARVNNNFTFSALCIVIHKCQKDHKDAHLSY